VTCACCWDLYTKILFLDVTSENKIGILLGRRNPVFVMSSKMGQPGGPIGNKTTKEYVKNPPYILIVNSCMTDKQ